MTDVYTPYGWGQIVGTETVRGRKSFHVAGSGFSVWMPETEVSLDETKIAGLHEAWAPIDHSNSTDLPYDPSPQYQAIGGGPDENAATIQPIHEIDPDERLHPSDSISFDHVEDDEGGPEPSPSRDLFAARPPLPRGAGGLEGDPHELHREWMERNGDEAYEHESPYFDDVHGHQAMRHEANPLALMLAPEALGAAEAAGGAAGAGGGVGAAEAGGMAQSVLPGAGGGHGKGLLQKGTEAVDNAVDALGPGSGWYPLIHDGSYRPAGLSDKYIDIEASADYHNDPVAQFRHDPDAYINRVGHVEDEGLNLRFAQYMDLVEADPQIRTAAWADVRQKAMRLKTGGKVHVKDMAPDRIYASVEGDHGTYDVMIAKGAAYGGFGGGHAISNWHCSCFLPDAPVMMADGTERPISELKPGDEVITHTGQVRRVVEIRPKPFSGEIARVRTNGSYREFVATSEHRVYSALANRAPAGDGGWAEVGTLQVGDYLSQSIMSDEQPLVVSIPRRPGHATTNKYGARGIGHHPGHHGGDRWTFTYKDGGRQGRPHTAYFHTQEEAVAASDRHHAERAVEDVKIDPDLAYWLGWYAAEGCLVKNSQGYRVAFTLAAHEGWVADQLDEISWSHFGVRGTRRHPADKGVIDYRVSNHTLYRLAELLVGTGSHDKKLAREMLSLPADERQRFLAGWLYGDGAVYQNGRHTISTVSQTLAHQAREMLVKDGWRVNITRQDGNTGGLPTTQGAGPIYQVRWMTRADSVYQFERDNSMFHRITSIDLEPYEGEVWDIEVEDDHSFRAFGFNAHNCEWGKWAFKRQMKFVGRLCSHGYASYLTMQSAHMKNQPRQTKLPRYHKRADNLQNGPKRLTPDLVVNDTDDAHTFLDVEKDERKDVGPDDVVSEKDIVHFARIMQACESRNLPYPRELIGFLARYADDQTPSDWEVEDASAAAPSLEEIRDLSREDDIEDHFGEMEDFNDELRDAVETAREDGVDADFLVARRRTADTSVDMYGRPVDNSGPTNVIPGRPVNPEKLESGAAGPPQGDPYQVNNFGGVSGGPGNSFPAGQATDRGPASRGDAAAPGGGINWKPNPGKSEVGYGPSSGPGAGGKDMSAPKGNAPGGAGPGGSQAPTSSGWHANDIAPGSIKPGDYEIKSGDTLAEIAQGAGIKDYNDIAKANNIADPNKINAGDTIKIPGGENPASPNGLVDGTNAGGALGTEDNPATPPNPNSTPKTDQSSANNGAGSASGLPASPPADSSAASASAASNPANSMTNPGLTTPGKTGRRKKRADWLGNSKPTTPTTTDTSSQTQKPATGIPAQTPSATTDTSSAADANSNTDRATTNTTSPTTQPGTDTSSTRPGGGQGNGMGLGGGAGHGIDIGQIGNMVGQGVGLAGDIAGGVGNAVGGIASGIGSAVSGLAGILGSNQSLFADQADYDNWHKFAYPADMDNTDDPDLLPHHPFNGSGWAGPLEIGTSEEYADKARKKHDDVTDLGKHDIHEDMGKWHRQSAKADHDDEDGDPWDITASTDDDSDIVRAFQRNAANSALNAPSGGDLDIAGAAQGFLRTAGRNYSLAEQEALIREGDRGGAGNLDELDLRNTHYESMNSVGLW